MQVKVLAAELSGGVQVESKDLNTIVFSNGKRLSFEVNLDELNEFLQLHHERIKHTAPIPEKDKAEMPPEAATIVGGKAVVQ